LSQSDGTTDLSHRHRRTTPIEIFLAGRMDAGFVILDEVGELFEVIDPVIERLSRVGSEAVMKAGIDLDNSVRQPPSHHSNN